MDGYELKTTFYDDFTIAEAFGTRAIEDTYRRAFEEWKTNVVYITELVMVLNWKLWNHWNAGRTEMAELYDRLWKEADRWCCDNLKGEDLSYFYSTTD